MPENPFSNLNRIEPAVDPSGQLSRVQTVKGSIPAGPLNRVQTNANSVISKASSYLIQTSPAPQGDDVFDNATTTSYQRPQYRDFSQLGTHMADTCILYSTQDPVHFIKFEEFNITADTQLKIVRTLPVRATSGSVKEWTAKDDTPVSIQFKLWGNNQLPVSQVQMIERMLADNCPIEVESEFLLAKGVQYIAVERFEVRQLPGYPWMYDCSLDGYSTQLIDLLQINA